MNCWIPVRFRWNSVLTFSCFIFFISTHKSHNIILLIKTIEYTFAQLIIILNFHIFNILNGEKHEKKLSSTLDSFTHKISSIFLYQIFPNPVRNIPENQPNALPSEIILNRRYWCDVNFVYFFVQD